MTKIAKSQYTSVVEMYLSCGSQPKVGAAFGVKHSAICQILKKMGVKKLHAPKQPRKNNTEARVMRAWGLSVSDYEASVAEHGPLNDSSSPMYKYRSQRARAKNRGIAWQFTFAEWWSIWSESGKWSERSQGGYVMARTNDGDAPYSPSTVYICTNSQNIKDAAINVPVHTRRHAALRGAGTGRGYSVDLRGRENPYFARFCGKALGNFPTPELARAAYLAAAEQYKATQPAA